MTAQQTETHYPMFRSAFPRKHLIKTTLFYSPNHGKAASSNRRCINTQAQKHKTPCLLLTEVKNFPSEKLGTYPKCEKSTFETVFSYVIICFVCVLCMNMKYYPNPNHYPFSKFRLNLEFGGLQ